MTLPFKGAGAALRPAPARPPWPSLYTTRSTASGFPAVVRLRPHRRLGVRPRAQHRLHAPGRSGVRRRRARRPAAATHHRRLLPDHRPRASRRTARRRADAAVQPRRHRPAGRSPAAAAAVVLPGHGAHAADPDRRQPRRDAGVVRRRCIASVESVGARMTLFLARYLNLSSSPVTHLGRQRPRHSASIRCSPTTASPQLHRRATPPSSTGSRSRCRCRPGRRCATTRSSGAAGPGRWR